VVVRTVDLGEGLWHATDGSSEYETDVSESADATHNSEASSTLTWVRQPVTCHGR